MTSPVQRALKHSCVPLSSAVLLAISSAPAWAQAQPEEDAAAVGNEILVTAQKREEKLKDVPVPVSAVGGAELSAQNQTKAQEFFASVPGVNLQFQNNRSQLAIRGVSTGPVSGNPVVGYTIDDAPFGASTGQGGLFGSAPDLDPSELARVEVLRGPQGTLYGASSMGGLVKYVTLDPSVSELSGSVAGGVALVKEGGEAGYNLRGAINVPLGETLAVRASAFTRKEAGYIDNIRTGERDVNSTKVSGGRIAALWKPTETFSLKLGAIYQVRDIYGSANVDSTTGSYYLQTDMPGSGRSRSETEMYTGTINLDLGGAELTSISAYSRAKNYDVLDFTASPLVLFSPVWPANFGTNSLGDIFRQSYDVNKFSHETRLAGSVGDNVDWIVGGFYTQEDARYNLDNYAIDPVTGATSPLAAPLNDGTGPQLGTVIVWRDTIKYKEYAGFANLTVRLSDVFDIQFGGRYSHNDQSMFHHDWIRFPNPNNPTETINEPKASGTAFTYQFSPRFKPSPDHMIYGRIASGYRPGGTNAVCGDAALPDEVPCQFKPDKTVNFELGAKGDLAGGLLSYDVSLFDIEWKDIQIVQVLGNYTANANVGKARSRGFEISLEARPTDRLSLTAWWAYVDATLREDADIAANFYALKGDRLPYSSKHSGRFGINYDLPISDGSELSMGASATYVGRRRGEFVPFSDVADLRAIYPGYVQFDVNAAVKVGQFTLSAFVQNLTNKHGVIGGGFWNQTSFNADWFNYAQPRTVGMNVEVRF